jgi:transposase
MRKGIATLAGLVTIAGHDVTTGDTYLFVGKNRRRAKCVWFDGNCARMLVNRIDSGQFAALWSNDGTSIELTHNELQLFLDGSKLVGKMALTPPPIDRKVQSRILPSAFH